MQEPVQPGKPPRKPSEDKDSTCWRPGEPRLDPQLDQHQGGSSRSVIRKISKVEELHDGEAKNGSSKPRKG